MSELNDDLHQSDVLLQRVEKEMSNLKQLKEDKSSELQQVQTQISTSELVERYASLHYCQSYGRLWLRTSMIFGILCPAIKFVLIILRARHEELIFWRMVESGGQQWIIFNNFVQFQRFQWF